MSISRTKPHDDALQERYLLPALPALLALLLAIVLSALHWAFGGDRLIERYREVAYEAFTGEDYPLAMIAFTRLVELEPRSEPFRFALALTSAELKHSARASAMMRELAPTDRLGFPAAHLWLAHQALARRPFTPDEVRDAEYHLLRVTQARPDRVDVNTTLGQLYLATRRADMAEPYLTRAAAADPRQKLALARMYAMQGQVESARSAAGQAVEVFAKLSQEQPESQTMRMRWAESLLLSGNDDGAEHVLRKAFADLPTGPFAAALVNFYRRRAQLVDDPQQRLSALRSAAELLATHGADTPETHALTAGVFIAIDELDQAEAHLEAAVADRRELGLELARLYAARGADEKARRQATETRDFLLAQLAEQPDNHVLRLLAANAAMWLEDFDQAEQMVQGGLAREQHPGLSAALAQLYVSWWNSLEIKPHVGGPDHSEQQLALLEKALSAQPGHFGALERLLVMRSRPGAAAKRAAELLTAIDPLENIPADSLLMLGTDAAQRGKLDLAITYLQPAHQLQRDSVIIANNLAWALAFAESPNLEKALEVADAAIERHPGNLNLRDTRGRILAAMKNWRQAQIDLEAAAGAMQGKVAYHQELAKVYEQLGRTDEAAEQRTLAAEAVTSRVVPQRQSP